jgi:putative LysE/RhtB family amino acid efflux pump
MDAAIVGFGLGFAVALQLGPMSLFLIRSTLRAGWRVGLAAGAGIAAVDALYAACGIAGTAPLLSLASVRTVLGLAGAALLLWLGARTLHSAFALRSGLEGARESASSRRAFALALAGTASNPATIVSWAALFAAANSVTSVHGTPGALLLVAGVCMGSLSWVSILATATAATRRLIGPRVMRAAEGVAGAAMLGFGGVLAYSTLRER